MTKRPASGSNPITKIRRREIIVQPGVCKKTSLTARTMSVLIEDHSRRRVPRVPDRFMAAQFSTGYESRQCVDYRGPCPVAPKLQPERTTAVQEAYRHPVHGHTCPPEEKDRESL